MTKNFTPPSSRPEIAAYVAALVNKPWEREGRHCWQLVIDVQRDLFGRVLPLVLGYAPPGGEGRRQKAALFANHPERANWRASEPVHGAVALMRRSAASPEMLVHAGVYLDLNGGGVLHCDDPQGVVLDSLLDLQLARRWAPPLFLVPK